MESIVESHQDRQVLLLTGTIRPPAGIDFVKRSDETVRQLDYVKAITFYLRQVPGVDVVFAENSGANLDTVRREVTGRLGREPIGLHLLSCSSRTSNDGRGKAYGEMLIIAEAMRLPILTDASHITKITGRLIVANIAKLLRSVRARPDVSVFCSFECGLTYSDSRVFTATPRFINERLLCYTEWVHESQYRMFENALGKAALMAVADGEKWGHYSAAPRFVGRCGATNERYGSFRERFRMMIRNRLMHGL